MDDNTFPDCLKRFLDRHISNECALEYCNSYTDLKNAFCGGKTTCDGTSVEAQRCRKHWVRYGRRETRKGGRSNNPTCMEERIRYQFTDECAKSYCNAYSDLKTAFCNGQDCNSSGSDGHVQGQKCRRHWYNHGKRETRRGSRRNNPECLSNLISFRHFTHNCATNYCNAYDDLKAAFCNGENCIDTNYDQAMRCRQHWFNHGKKEIKISRTRDVEKIPPCLQHKIGNVLMPRECSLEYCNAYPDLKNAFCNGNTCTTLQHHRRCRTHWFRHGRYENRPNNPSCIEAYEFDFSVPCALEYCNSQEDLQRAYCSSGTTINRCNSKEQGKQCRYHWFRAGRFETARTNLPSCLNREWRRELLSRPRLSNHNIDYVSLSFKQKMMKMHQISKDTEGRSLYSLRKLKLDYLSEDLKLLNNNDSNEIASRKMKTDSTPSSSTMSITLSTESEVSSNSKSSSNSYTDIANWVGNMKTNINRLLSSDSVNQWI